MNIAAQGISILAGVGVVILFFGLIWLCSKD